MIDMTSQTFKVVGITSHNGNAKVRFTDDLVRRVKQFTKGGATRCDFIELAESMTKVDALRFMLGHEQFQSAGDQATITDSIEDRVKEAQKGVVKVTVKGKAAKTAKSKTAKSKAKPSLDAIKSRARKQTTAEDVLNAVSTSDSESVDAE
jgi:GTP cyclohydrolase III